VTDSQTPVPAQGIFPAPLPSPPSTGGLIQLNTNADEVTNFPCQSGTSVSLQANTPYAFLFSGFDANGPVTFSGSFTADASGNLTGVEDIVRPNGTQLPNPLFAGTP